MPRRLFECGAGTMRSMVGMVAAAFLFPGVSGINPWPSQKSGDKSPYSKGGRTLLR
jgi:hypothetical protein